jgi:hypothetical protein
MNQIAGHEIDKRRGSMPRNANACAVDFNRDEAVCINRFGGLHCCAFIIWDANCVGETTMQCREAVKSGWPLVVLSSHRWTKVLVRRQGHGFEIPVGMAARGIPATGLQ